MKKIIILGAGMVGKAIAIDLAKKYDVTSADIDSASLEYLSKNYNIKTKYLDVNVEAALAYSVKHFDLVVSAVPGFLGFQTISTVIKSGKNLVDISFLPEDITPLKELAVEYNVTAVMDCGVAPGLPNYIAGYLNEIMEIENFKYMVGGLPKIRTFPFQYKAPFSPCDVIEEYTRPARYKKNKKILSKPAMSTLELVEFEKAGTLEAFNSDGLRSLLYILPKIINMKEETLRYPGHIKMIKALMAAGFLDRNPVDVNGVEVVPFDFTSKILFNSWKLDAGEPEFTILRINVVGCENGVKKLIVYDLYDEYDKNENLSSMARTTGFTAAATADMILNGVFTSKGLFPPEIVGKHYGCLNYVLEYLKERNIVFEKNELTL